MTLIDSWGIVNNHTYFARPYYNSDGSLITFGVDFYKACDISPVEHNGKIYWDCEMGSWALDGIGYYHDYNFDMMKSTYEELIITIAELLVEKFGMDLLDDYYYIDEQEPLMIKDGKYFVSNPKSKSGWKVEELMEKIKSYENN